MISKAEGLELGKLYVQVADFDSALEVFEKILDDSFEAKNWEKYSQVVPLALRIYAERMDLTEIERLKQKLLQLETIDPSYLTAKVHYTLGISAIYSGNISSAKKHFFQSEELAKASGNLEDLCNALFGLVAYFIQISDFASATIHLNALLENNTRLGDKAQKVSIYLWQAIIFRNLKNYGKAFECLELAQECLPKTYNAYLTINILYGLGVTYFASKQYELARHYLRLADSLLDRKNMKKTSQEISQYMLKLKSLESTKGDLVLDEDSEMIYEKQKGAVSIGNQFILIELLKLFGRNPGHIFSKERIVELIWKEKYDPLVHDNKIYVTIKRLRTLVELNKQKPTYIKKGKGGYYFNCDKIFNETNPRQT